MNLHPTHDPKVRPWLHPAARAIAAGLGAVVAIGALFWFDPAVTPWFPRCPFHALTGLHCPGCGASRAAHHLLNGRLGAAFDRNPLLVVALPLVAYLLACEAAALRGLRLRRPLTTARSVWGLLGAIVAFTVLRNLPFAPWGWMAP